MRIHTILLMLTAAVLFTTSAAADKPSRGTPFFEAFKTICVDTRLELPAIQSELQKLGAKADLEFTYSDSKAIPEEQRIWDVYVGGEQFKVSYLTFDMNWPDNQIKRDYECWVQSFAKKNTSWFSETQHWLGLKPSRSRRDNMVFRYRELGGHRIPFEYGRDNFWDGPVWTVELNQTDGMPSLDIGPVGSMTFSTTRLHPKVKPK